MKKSLALLTTVLWPIAALAQNPAKTAEEPATPAFIDTAVPAPILDRVEFHNADLPAIIEYLKAKNEELGQNQRDLNIIISPGLESLRVPELSLRNVTVADVLTIASTVLDVQLEPVTNAASGETVAWIVKGKAASPVPAIGAPITSVIPATSFGGGSYSVLPDTSGASPTVVPIHGAGGGLTSAPAEAGSPGGAGTAGGGSSVVELASSGAMASGMGGSGFGTSRPTTKVFSAAALIASTKPDAAEREHERREKFAILTQRLQKLANDHRHRIEIKGYDEMDILVVKSEDAEGINLIAETIEALKMNAADDRANQFFPRAEKGDGKAAGQ
jgi:hypothetical protein